MDFKTIIIFLIVYLLGIVQSDGSKINDCTLLTELECALYTTDSNELRLNQAFFSPRESTSRYINVIYTFNNSEPLCEVKFIWAIGGFLLIQPPQVFQLTSLFFSNPANSQDNLTITLPEECQSLVGGDNCTCLGNEDNNLDILTQQVSCFRTRLHALFEEFEVAKNTHSKTLPCSSFNCSLNY